LVVIGGGSACGKYCVQWARYIGFGKIVVVASKEKSKEELRSLGATHVINRHGSVKDVDAQVREVVGGESVYSVDCISLGPGAHTLGARLLSNSKRGLSVTLTAIGGVDEEEIGEKRQGMSIGSLSSFRVILSWLPHTGSGSRRRSRKGW